MFWSFGCDLHRGLFEVRQWHEGVQSAKISNLAEKQHYVISVGKTVEEADFGMQSSYGGHTGSGWYNVLFVIVQVSYMKFGNFLHFHHI